MPAARLAILLSILSVSILFALQNWSPSLPLVFFGTTTQALPLGVWIAIAIAAGAMTTILTAGLLQIAPALTSRAKSVRHPTTHNPATPPYRNASPPPYESGSTPSTSSQPQDRSTYQSEPNRPIYPESSRIETPTRWQTDLTDSEFDWQEEPEPIDDEFDWEDWEEEPEPVDNRASWQDWEERTKPSESFSQNQQSKRSVTSDAVQKFPKPNTSSSSAYSYSYQNPKDSHVGKNESVYDAEYRVIIPPYRPLDSNEEDEEFEEDDF